MLKVSTRFLLLTTACIACFSAALWAATSDKKEPAPEIKLERVPPMTIEQELASVEVAPGFRMELVAADPQIASPVAIAVDENNQMYVVEMRDYSEKDKEHLGRIRLLTDRDGDGRYETSKVFLDKLSWPTAITCYGGGVFIGDPPNIRYAKDTD